MREIVKTNPIVAMQNAPGPPVHMELRPGAKKQEPIVVGTKGSGSDAWLKPKLVASF